MGYLLYLLDLHSFESINSCALHGHAALSGDHDKIANILET